MLTNSSGRCMSLHVEVTGSGEPLVMLHGWGMHGGIWSDTAAQLAGQYQVHCVDLPGYGASVQTEAFTLDSVVERLVAYFSEPVTVCGWSLGGQIALHWALREPQQVKRLVLVTSTPCFAAREDWSFGMPQETLAQFAADLEKNHAATLRRFLSLQVRGSEGERELLGILREKLFSRGEPRLDALRGGLEILRDADQRDSLPEIRQPVLVIAGERDKLTLPQASQYMAQALPDARLAQIEGSAHVPFLSHPQVFLEHMKSFLHERI
jgi:pimeloyl-[acyl-carrier protein] methyl ester esterase